MTLFIGIDLTTTASKAISMAGCVKNTYAPNIPLVLEDARFSGRRNVVALACCVLATACAQAVASTQHASATTFLRPENLASSSTRGIYLFDLKMRDFKLNGFRKEIPQKLVPLGRAYSTCFWRSP